MFDDELDFWDYDEPSHWFRKLVFLSLGAVAAYYYAQYKAKQSGNSDPLTSSTSFRPVPSEPSAPKDESRWEKLESSQPAPEQEHVVDVTEAEVGIVGEYVLEDEVIGEYTEIDLALEEDIENDDLDEDDDDEADLEGVLTEEDNEDEEESILEPSPNQEPPKWVAAVNGQCPEGFPIKARFSTGRYHLVGDRGYAKINPDCCYESTEDAEADGFTHSRWS